MSWLSKHRSAYWRSAIALTVTLAALASGCGASSPRQPAGAPPTPTSVTHEQPGGDAADPHFAALQRELTERWGWRRDKDNQLSIPLADKPSWRRVRYFMVDHFTGFRYGDEGHSLNVVLVQDIEPKLGAENEPPDAGACLTRAEEWAKPQLDVYGVRVTNVTTTYVTWKKKHRIPVRVADAHFEYLFEKHDVAAAWASYPAYPDACLVFGIMVPWREHREVAEQVRDRWVKEGVPRLKPRTKTRPTRKE